MNNIFDKTIIDKKIECIWGTSGVRYTHIFSNDVHVLRIFFQEKEEIELIYIKKSLYIDFGGVIDFIHLKHHTVINAGTLSNSDWSFIEQLLINIENTFSKPLEFEWWEAINKMKELEELYNSFFK